MGKKLHLEAQAGSTAADGEQGLFYTSPRVLESSFCFSFVFTKIAINFIEEYFHDLVSYLFYDLGLKCDPMFSL